MAEYAWWSLEVTGGLVCCQYKSTDSQATSDSKFDDSPEQDVALDPYVLINTITVFVFGDHLVNSPDLCVWFYTEHVLLLRI